MVPEIYGGCQGKFLDIGAGRAGPIIIIIGYNGCEIVEFEIMSTLRGKKSQSTDLEQRVCKKW